MGSKVHPLGFRLGYIKDWQSRWFSERNYTDQLHEDLSLRKLVMKRFEGSGVARVEIERSANRAHRQGGCCGRQGWRKARRIPQDP